MADDGDSEGSNESGSTLRAKLEAALASQTDLSTQLAGYKAKDVISELGLKNVKPEDIQGFALNEMAAKAAEMETAKAQQAEDAVRTVLSNRGLKGDALDNALKSLLGTAEPVTEVLGRIRTAGTVQAAPPEHMGGVDLNDGHAMIRAAFAKK